MFYPNLSSSEKEQSLPNDLLSATKDVTQVSVTCPHLSFLLAVENIYASQTEQSCHILHIPDRFSV